MMNPIFLHDNEPGSKLLAYNECSLMTTILFKYKKTRSHVFQSLVCHVYDRPTDSININVLYIYNKEGEIFHRVLKASSHLTQVVGDDQRWFVRY